MCLSVIRGISLLGISAMFVINALPGATTSLSICTKSINSNGPLDIPGSGNASIAKAFTLVRNFTCGSGLAALSVSVSLCQVQEARRWLLSSAADSL